MNRNLKAFLTLVLASSLVGAHAQTSSATGSAATPHKKTAKKAVAKKEAGSTVEEQIRELREDFQQQITDLKAQIAARDAQLQQAQQTAQAAQQKATDASAKADTVSSSVAQSTQAVTSLQGAVSDLKTSDTNLIQTVQDSQKTIQKQITEAVDSPSTLHYKGVTITPIAFLAAESVDRTRSLNSDINTPFNAVPYPGAAQWNVSEFNATGRQSRIGALFQGKLPNLTIGGYVEADFLNAGATSNNNESNSYPLRFRQAWAQAAMNNGFTVTGGQMWSLVTETKHSTDPRSENMPQTIDPQYHVGFSWTRQYGVRFSKMFAGNKATIAASVEESQGLYAGSNVPSNFFIGGGGNGGGLFNPTTNYTNNIAPDFVVKAAFDPGYGHYEIFGLARFFRDRYYPNQATKSTVGATNATAAGGGIGFNARFPVTTKADFGLHVLTGDGVGRYGSVTLPDFTVHPDGTPAPIRATQALLTLEPHVTKKLDLYINSGVEYAQRTTYLNSNGVLVGYAPQTLNNTGCSTETLPTATGNGFAGGAPYNPGTPANCAGVTKAVFEDTIGLWYRFYNGPKGSLRYGMQYSYLDKHAWTGIGGAPKGQDNMVYTSFRYYLP